MTSYSAADVPRVPDELLAADVPDWVMRVWLAIRKVQGDNPWAWGARKHYAEVANKDRGQVTHAITVLVEAGWLEEGEGRQLRCHVGEPVVRNPYEKAGKVEPRSHNPVTTVCEQDSTECEQDSTECEQDSPPSESSQESNQEPSHAGPAASAASPATVTGEARAVEPDALGFDAFWEAYGHKVGSKTKTRRKWERLSRRKRAAIMAHLPAFVASTPDVRFRPYPLTYLNGERWQDEHLPTARAELPPLDLTAVLAEAEVHRAQREMGLSREDFYRADTDTRTGAGLYRLRPERRAALMPA